MDLPALIQECVPVAYQERMARIVAVESSRNPYAIGVVGGRLERQPKTAGEAVATAKALHAAGWNFSMGYAQVNKYNLERYKLDLTNVFDGCRNLKAGAAILAECDQRATRIYSDSGRAQDAAHSCYYSGNFSRGFKPDHPGGTSYVQRVAAAASKSGLKADKPIKVIPQKPAQQKREKPKDQEQQTEQATPEQKPRAARKWDVFGDF